MTDYYFVIRVWKDDELVYSARYTDAVSAVHSYDSFKDYGDAERWREILLFEPSGKAHSKRFDAPAVA